MFNPLQSSACLMRPERLSGISAWTHHLPVAFALVEILRPRVFVELGTHKGDSYCAFCQAVKKLHLETRCFAVDTWTGDEHSGLYGEEVLAELSEHHHPRYSDFSTLLQSTFDDARQRFADGTIDLLHIDGYHTYEAVRHDFETWLPAMSSRGVVLFHDTQVKERGFGVWRFWEEVAARYDHIELRQCNGLGILVVGAERSVELQALLEAGSNPAWHELFDLLGCQLDAPLHERRLNEHIANQQEHIANQNAQVAWQQGSIDSLKEHIAGLEEHIANLEAHSGRQQQHIDNQQEHIHQQDLRLAELNDTLYRQEAQMKEYAENLSRYSKEIERLSTEHHHLTGRLQVLEYQMTRPSAVLAGAVRCIPGVRWAVRRAAAVWGRGDTPANSTTSGCPSAAPETATGTGSSMASDQPPRQAA